MQPVLDSGILERLAARDLLVALDFDGTLAPIVADPAAAALRPGTRRLLAAVAQRYPCAVISGRAEAEVLRMLAGVTVWYVIGQRGIDPQVSRWSAALSALCIPGLAFEDKGAALAVHYRACADREQARQAILAAARALGNARVVAGKEVVNLIPATAPDKGAAVERLRLQLGGGPALYAGDDNSDEAVFALKPAVTSIRVEPSAHSAADYFLRDQEEIDALLERLVELRPLRERRPESAHHGFGVGFNRNRSLLPE